MVESRPTLIVASSETRTRRAVIAPITRSLNKSTFNKNICSFYEQLA